MREFDWIDLTRPEHQQFLLTAANDMSDELKNASLTYQKCEEQAAYIEVLEKQVRLLQKTLDVAYKNKVLVRRVKKWQKSNG